MTKLELMALLVAIAFVLIAEMVNTAIEATIDLGDHLLRPAREAAKDVAAGAVLVAAVYAIVIGYLVFADRLVDAELRLVTRLAGARNLTLIALILIILIVIAGKALRARDAASGGLPSGHAALAFGGFTALAFVVGRGRERVSSPSWR